jgi:nicotinamide mononucleotide transporter PnuC
VLDQLIKFKGSDWMGMVFGLIATYYLAKGRRRGFLFGIIGGFGWVTFGFLTGSVARVLANLAFIAVNCHGFFRWTRKREEQQTEE